jgi:hypothetical protein
METQGSADYTECADLPVNLFLISVNQSPMAQSVDYSYLRYPRLSASSVYLRHLWLMVDTLYGAICTHLHNLWFLVMSPCLSMKPLVLMVSGY